MKKIFAFSMMAALVLASCSPKEQFAPTVVPEVGKTIRATVETGTRTTMVEDGDVYHVFWKAGDIIRCSDNDHRAYYQTTEDGVQSATFTYLDVDNPEYVLSPDSLQFWAYFPPDPGRKLVATQQYCENGIAAAPMRGYYERTAEEPFDPNFVFKHVCGALKLNLTTTQEDVKVVKIVLRADNGLSGSYTTLPELSGQPTIDTYYRQYVSGQTAPVALDCPEVAIGAEPKPFFISVPPFVYGAFSVQVITSDGRMQTRSLKQGETLEIERAKVYDLSLAFDDLQKPAVGETATFTKGRDMNSIIKGIINPDVASYSDDDTLVTKIVFQTEQDVFSAVNVADAASESPIYVFWDEANTTITVSTPAKKFVMNVDSWGFFHRFKALKTVVGIEGFDSSNVEQMAYFFSYTGLDNITMPSTWDYSKVISTRYMFSGVSAQTIDLTAMDFSQDTSMAFMFSYIDGAPEIIWPNEVDCSNVTSMASMFRYSKFSLVDLSPLTNTDAVTTIRYMFGDDTLLSKVIANFDLSALNTGTSGIGYCFFHCSEWSGELDLTEFDVSTAATFSDVFRTCYASTIDLSTWDITGAGYWNRIFYGCKYLRNLYLGPDFLLESSPSNMWGEKALKENGTSASSGSLNIYCTQETATWLAKVTTLFHLKSGNWTGGVMVDIHFYDIDSPTTELEVVWRES